MENAKCYSYIRVSTNMQTEGYSLDAQRDRINKFAEFQKMEIVREYCDAGKSGKSVTGRPEFQNMLDDIVYGKDQVDYVLVFKLSRFGRNAADVLNSLQLLQDYKVNLICVEDGIDSSKESGKLTITVLSAVAEIERENILVQTMEGRRQKAREGKWNGGVPPYGYYLDKENDTIIPDAEEAGVVRLIYKLYVEDDMGLVEIADYLNAHGYKKRKYRERDLDIYTANFIRLVLDNPVYIGKISYGRNKMEKVRGTRDEYRRVKSKEYMLTDGLHEGIVDEALWQGAQEKNCRVAKRLKKKHDLDHEYLLSGLINCPICGDRMTGTTVKRKDKNTGQIKYEYYYRCHNRKHLEDGRKCDYKAAFNEEKFDQEVFDVIQSFVSSPGCRDAIMKHFDDRIDVSGLETEREQLTAQLRQVKGAKNKLQEKLDSLSVDDRFYEQKYEDMTDRLTNLYEKINTTEENIRMINRRINQIREKHLTSQDIYKALLHFEELFSCMTDLEKKEFYQNFIEEIEVHQDRSRQDRMVKSILFNFTMYYNGQEGDKVSLPKNNTDETVCLLSNRKPDTKVRIDVDLEDYYRIRR